MAKRGVDRATPAVKYPILTAMLRDLLYESYGIDYGAHVKPETQWVWPANAKAMETTAAGLSKGERADLVMGEDRDQKRIISERPGAGAVWEFLCAVFDGHLAQNFVII